MPRGIPNKPKKRKTKKLVYTGGDPKRLAYTSGDPVGDAQEISSLLDDYGALNVLAKELERHDREYNNEHDQEARVDLNVRTASANGDVHFEHTLPIRMVRSAVEEMLGDVAGQLHDLGVKLEMPS